MHAALVHVRACEVQSARMHVHVRSRMRRETENQHQLSILILFIMEETECDTPLS